MNDLQRNCMHSNNCKLNYANFRLISSLFLAGRKSYQIIASGRGFVSFCRVCMALSRNVLVCPCLCHCIVWEYMQEEGTFFIFLCIFYVVYFFISPFLCVCLSLHRYFPVGFSLIFLSNSCFAIISLSHHYSTRSHSLFVSFSISSIFLSPFLPHFSLLSLPFLPISPLP